MNKTKSRINKLILLLIIASLTGSIIYGAFIYHNEAQIHTAVKLDGSYKLVFGDDFSGDVLDNNKWATCYDRYDSKLAGCSNYGNNEDEWYQSSQISIRNGSLVLTADRTNTIGSDGHGSVKNYAYKSGMVSSGSLDHNTAEKWSSKYGYFEAKIKVPSGQAAWPAFWLLPSNHQWPPEIDVMEITGDKPNTLLATYFWPVNSAPQKDNSKYISKNDLSTDWHIYSLNWGPNEIIWYLDGKVVKSVKSTNVSSQNMYVLLNLAVGGNLPGKPDKTTPSKLEMLVDYVRVYQK